uniref:Cytosine-specific methyltransferase n=1 Tax=Fagus sylvatica TaxID=28930 RepID=A0A2N9FEZ0_FAGSY
MPSALVVTTTTNLGHSRTTGESQRPILDTLGPPGFAGDHLIFLSTPRESPGIAGGTSSLMDLFMDHQVLLNLSISEFSVHAIGHHGGLGLFGSPLDIVGGLGYLDSHGCSRISRFSHDAASTHSISLGSSRNLDPLSRCLGGPRTSTSRWRSRSLTETFVLSWISRLGDLAWISRPNRDKLDPPAHKCIFPSYSRTKKGYRCYNPTLSKHFVSVDVTFFEDVPYYSPQGAQFQVPILSTPVLPTPVHIVPPTPPFARVYVRWHNRVVPPVPDSPPPSTSDLDLPIAIRNNKRTCTDHPNFVSFDHLPPFKAFSLSVSSLVVPKLYKEALSHLGWRKAMVNGSGNACFKLNHTWDLIPKPAVVYVDGIVITGSEKEGIQILISHLSLSFLTKDLDNSVKSHDVSSPDGIKSVHTMATTTILENVPNCETYGPDLALLDLFSGCGGMSTGLCLGAKLSGVNLATRWALDCDKSACKSLKLNHPETHVRNETAENFLELLKEWEKLCKHYKVSDVGTTHQSRAKTLRSHKCDEKSVSDDEVPSGEFEVSRLVDICYGEPNKKGKRGLHFKVHWKGYSASEDTWEPVEGLSNCQEKMQDFVRNGLKLKILPLPGDVDVICGGPPCQGISGYNRYRNIDSPLADDRNHQIVVFMDIVEFLKPKYVLMENVIDILRFDKASLGRYALSRLVHMNYQARLGTIAAGCFGLPQFRLRVFLWGAHPSEKLPQFPLPTHDVIVRYWPPPEFERNTVALDEDQPRELEKALVLQDAISDLPPVTSFETREEMSYKKPPETDFQRYIRSTRYEMTGLTLDDSRKTPSLYDHRPYALSEDDYLRGANFRDLPGVVVGSDNVVRRDPTEQKLLPSGKPLVPDYAFTFEQGRSKRPFARLWWDETVPTVVTFPSCHNQAALHPEQDRPLTIREYARLQGFPDYYRFCGTIKERYCQTGNAVAVPVARALGYAMGLAFRKLIGDEPLMTLPPKFSQSNYLQLAKSLSHESH